MKCSRRAWLLLLALLALAPVWGENAPAPAARPAGLAEMKKQFESSVRELQRQGLGAVERLRQRYLADMANLEQALQEEGGHMQAVLQVREESARFAQEEAIPDRALAGWPALRKLQEAWREQTAAEQQAQAKRIIAACNLYLQNLATLEKSLADGSDREEQEAVRAEQERLRSSSMVGEALAELQPGVAATKTNAPVAAVPKEQAPVPVAAGQPGGYAFYAVGDEPALKDLRLQRMAFPGADRRAAQFFYELQVSVALHDQSYQDKDKMSYTIHAAVPRLVLTVKNRDLREGSLLVIEYFSRSTTHIGPLKLEKAEHIGLPAKTRNQTFVVDGRGLRLGKPYGKDMRSGKFNNHYLPLREFYGLVVSLFDPQGSLLFQQCSSTMLTPFCGTTPTAVLEAENPLP